MFVGRLFYSGMMLNPQVALTVCCSYELFVKTGETAIA
jgi:hypothetical protein